MKRLVNVNWGDRFLMGGTHIPGSALREVLRFPRNYVPGKGGWGDLVGNTFVGTSTAVINAFRLNFFVGDSCLLWPTRNFATFSLLALVSSKKNYERECTRSFALKEVIKTFMLVVTMKTVNIGTE